MLHELKVKQDQFNDALVMALGLSVASNITPANPPTGMFARFFGDPPTFPMAIPGKSFPVKVHVAESGPLPIKIDGIELKTPGTTGWGLQARGNSSGQLDGGRTFDAVFDVHIADNTGYTRPSL